MHATLLMPYLQPLCDLHHNNVRDSYYEYVMIIRGLYYINAHVLASAGIYLIYRAAPPRVYDVDVD